MNYNSYGYLASVSAEGSTRYAITAMNARQQITAATYGSNLAASYGFDDYGYPTYTTTGSIQDYRYSFTASTGNLYSRQNYLRNLSETFTCDNLDRLTGVSGPQNLTMTYNANGNIATKSDVGSVQFGYNNSSKPYALTDIEATNGLVSDSLQTATYASFEQVSTIDEGNYHAVFTYNSNDQRAKMLVTESGSTILTRWYAGSRYMKETAGSVTKEYTYIGGDAYTAPVVAVTQSGTTTYYYLLRDHLGSVTHLVNTSNTVVAEYNFDAWGRRRSVDDWSYTLDANDLALFADRSFTAHEYLPWFKLVNMNGRLYDPVVGRFLSPDNSIQNPLASQNYNRYSYCLNNPLKYTAPSGEAYYLKQASKGVVDYQTPIDYANNIGIGRHYNYDGDIVGGGGSAALTYSYSKGIGYYYDSAGNLVIIDNALNTSTIHLPPGTSRHSVRFGHRNGVDGVWYQTVNFSPSDGNLFGTDLGLFETTVISTFVSFNSNTASGGVRPGFDIDQAVDYLNAHANSSSQGACSRYVQNALIAGGIKADNPVQAGRKYGPLLEGWGFNKVTSTLPNYSPIKGDIAVIQGYPGGTADKNGVPYGHIQMYNGSQWVSDFFQNRPFWPGRDYEKYKPALQIYRW